MSGWVAMVEGVQRRIVIDGEKLMMVEVEFQPHAVVAHHNHPHEQVTYIMRGQLRFTLDGREILLNAGDRLLIPAMQWHGASATEQGCLVMDTFSPPREDFR